MGTQEEVSFLAYSRPRSDTVPGLAAPDQERARTLPSLHLMACPVVPLT